jgi:hypothetical protein
MLFFRLTIFRFKNTSNNYVSTKTMIDVDQLAAIVAVKVGYYCIFAFVVCTIGNLDCHCSLIDCILLHSIDYISNVYFSP